MILDTLEDYCPVARVRDGTSTWAGQGEGEGACDGIWSTPVKKALGVAEGPGKRWELGRTWATEIAGLSVRDIRWHPLLDGGGGMNGGVEGER